MTWDSTHDEEEHPFYWAYIPTVVNVVLLVIFGQIYTILSRKIVENENH